MSSSEKLAIFLNVLSHHEKNRSIKFDYIRSGWSVSQAFNECLCAILKLTPLLLVNPKPILEDETEDRWKWFEGCLGALDGTYIPIRVLTQYKPRYRTRKGEIATNVLGVYDRNLNFTYMLPGWEGPAADGRILRDAIVRTNGLRIPKGEMNSQTSSTKASKKPSNSTPSTRRMWIPEEEQTLLDGLKELCANGWRGDNGTFRPGHLMELERYIHKHHPKSALKGEPHIKNKMQYWKKCYGIIALLKTQSGLGFQYSDGAILLDNPTFWDNFLNDWEEIFGKDRATGEFVEAPLDAIEDIQKSRTPQLCNDMSLGFLIDVDDEEEGDVYHSYKIGTGEAENAAGHSAFTIAEDATEPSSFGGAENATRPSVFTGGENVAGASAGTSVNENVGSRQTHKQGEYAKRSSSNVNEKEKNKKRKKIVEDDNKTFIEGMMEVLKFFTEVQDKRMGSLIEKLGQCDRSDVRCQVYSILKSPVFFELYTVQQRIKAATVLCKDDKKNGVIYKMELVDKVIPRFSVLRDKSFREIMVGAPKLEFFELFSCWGYNDLTLDSLYFRTVNAYVSSSVQTLYGFVFISAMSRHV
ncbi:putative HUA2-like protein 3-like [Capsicum annuum]|nr:putative HUA2-like protein 3-like [Capsicum annuum]